MALPSKLLFITLTALSLNIEAIAQKSSKPNVLFIAIDDLKPILGCYGDPMIKTPNIDRLANMGTVFKSNYCQQAVCGPTRASLMSGMRPDVTKIWDLKTKMRDMNPDILTLPQYFASQGYSTQGIGKVYDPRCVDEDLDKPSWTIPFYKTDKKYYDSNTGEPVLGFYQSKQTRMLAEKYGKEATEKGLKGSEAKEYVLARIKPSVECVDVADNAYNDGANILQARDILKDLKNKNKPFFFAVGIAKPHLPFVAPKKYWDLYQRTKMPIAEFQEKSKNAMDVAYHNSGEIRAYSDIPPLLSFTDQKSYGITLPIDKQRELIHGYYASVSYADALVGVLLNTLDSLGLSKNTIVVLWGDHGWHLGDHNLWCKHSNFEQAAHAPLIFFAPNVKPSVSSSLTEFVDVFPTLCDLAGLPIPSHLAGKSLLPVMKDPSIIVNDYSVSQYPRSSAGVETERQGYAAPKIMGYSLRTSQYRFTLWMKDFRSNQAFSASAIVGIELYDYDKDPLETNNVAKDKKYSTISKSLYNKMLDFFRHERDRHR
jgi:arylsulfatase A-like enzyme